MTATASGSAASETAHFSPKKDAGGKPWRRHFVMTVKPVRMCLGWLDWLGCSAQPNGCSGAAEQPASRGEPANHVVVTSSYIHSQHPASSQPAIRTRPYRIVKCSQLQKEPAERAKEQHRDFWNLPRHYYSSVLDEGGKPCICPGMLQPFSETRRP